MLKICVCVSGGGTNLQAIIDAIDNGTITNAEIVRVISNNKGVYALERAQKHNIDAMAISPKDYETRELFNDALLAAIDEAEPDLVVLAGFLVVLPTKLIQKYSNRIINIHPSLIPSFAGPGCYGLRVHKMAYERGVKVAGATVHFVTSEVDGGPIILQRAIDISKAQSPEEIQEMILLNIEHKILPEAVKLFCENKLKVIERRVEII